MVALALQAGRSGSGRGGSGLVAVAAAVVAEVGIVVVVAGGEDAAARTVGVMVLAVIAEAVSQVRVPSVKVSPVTLGFSAPLLLPVLLLLLLLLLPVLLLLILGPAQVAETGCVKGP
jgi:phosphatidylserine synthase